MSEIKNEGRTGWQNVTSWHVCL